MFRWCGGTGLLSYGQRLEEQMVYLAYDLYAECVRLFFCLKEITLNQLLFEIIGPYSINRQGKGRGKKYRRGVYSRRLSDLENERESA